MTTKTRTITENEGHKVHRVAGRLDEQVYSAEPEGDTSSMCVTSSIAIRCKCVRVENVNASRPPVHRTLLVDLPSSHRLLSP